MTLPAQHFDHLYASCRDPWGYEERWYERRKHRLTLACLPAERYRRAFEPGCSIGVLTVLLSERCEAVVAADMSPIAIDRAREATEGLACVEVLQLQVPDEWPEGRFDLVVFSELGYYLDSGALDRLIQRAGSSLVSGGHLVATHWRGAAGDFLNPGGAEEVHARLRAAPGWAQLVTHREDGFLVDVLERTS